MNNAGARLLLDRNGIFAVETPNGMILVVVACIVTSLAEIVVGALLALVPWSANLFATASITHRGGVDTVDGNRLEFGKSCFPSRVFRKSYNHAAAIVAA